MAVPPSSEAGAADLPAGGAAGESHGETMDEDVPPGEPNLLGELLQHVPPYELCTSTDVPGLAELHAQLRAARLDDHEERSIVDKLLACERAAPAHRLGPFPAIPPRTVHIRTAAAADQLQAAHRSHPHLQAAHRSGSWEGGEAAERGSDLDAIACVTQVILLRDEPGSL